MIGSCTLQEFWYVLVLGRNCGLFSYSAGIVVWSCTRPELWPVRVLDGICGLLLNPATATMGLLLHPGLGTSVATAKVLTALVTLGLSKSVRRDAHVLARSERSSPVYFSFTLTTLTLERSAEVNATPPFNDTE